jgi:hypothetical protein
MNVGIDKQESSNHGKLKKKGKENGNKGVHEESRSFIYC